MKIVPKYKYNNVYFRVNSENGGNWEPSDTIYYLRQDNNRILCYSTDPKDVKEGYEKPTREDIDEYFRKGWWQKVSNPNI